MKKIITLTEEDLSNIIRQLISEQQTIGLAGIKGNTVKDVVTNLDSQKKIIKDKWGRPNIKNGKPSLWFGYDSKVMKWVEGPCKNIYKDKETCKKILDGTIDSIRGSKNSKYLRPYDPPFMKVETEEDTYCRKNIRLSSPGDVGYEKFAVGVAKTLGIVQFGISSQSDLIDKLLTIKSKRIEYGCNRPLESIVIGTHGNHSGEILFTHGNNYTKDNSKILNSIKPLVGKNTMVFFTACYGADFLLPLKNASQFLGTKVRGSAGIYTPILNNSENGFYECAPSPKFDVQTLYEKDEEPYGSDDFFKNLLKPRKLVTPEFINKYLLKNNMCKKVSSPGISWFN